MPPALHSDFSASSSSRLLACPGSYELGRVAAQVSGNQSSVYAAEGTLAHSLAESALTSGMDLQQVIGRTYTVAGFEFTVDEEFIENVMLYVNQIRLLDAMGYVRVLETVVDPSIHWAGLPDLGVHLFGTADCIAYHPVTEDLRVLDLKFGSGIPVEARGNTQLLYYAAGALNLQVINNLRALASLPPYLPEDEWTPSVVFATIIQPRAFHPEGAIREVCYSTQEIVDWSRFALYTGVETAVNDNGQTLKPGESQCRWCPARPCSAQIEHSKKLSLALFASAPDANVPIPGLDLDTQTLMGVTEFGTPATTAPVMQQDTPDHGPSISDARLVELLDMAEVIKPMIKALEAIAEDRLSKNSTALEGKYKLVPKVARRTWIGDPAAIMADLKREAIPEHAYTEAKLRTPAQVEKHVSRKEFSQIVAKHIQKTSSGVNLAPIGDPRQRALRGPTAQEAFGFKGSGKTPS